MYEWSAKQAEAGHAIVDGTDRRVIISGPTQCGKSALAGHAFMLRAAEYSGQDILLCAHSQRQMTGAVLKYAEEAQKAMGLEWHRTSDYWIGGSADGGQNRFFTLLGNNEGSEGRARSFTAAQAWVDEGTVVPESFLRTVSDRCSVPGSIVLVTTNPDSIHHHLYKNWVQSRHVNSFEFELNDNPFVSSDPGYLQTQLDMYHGPARERMVFGKWVAAEGVVYPYIPISEPPAEEPERYIVGADYAHSGITHAVLIGDYGDTQYVLREWRWHGQRQGIKNDVQLAESIKRDMCGGIKPSLIVSDPSAPNFRKSLEFVFNMKAYKAENAVAEGIQYVRKAFEDQTLIIAPGCNELLRELHMYRWDEKAALLGLDRPVKQDDHGADALRYGVYSYAKALLQMEKKLEVKRLR